MEFDFDIKQLTYELIREEGVRYTPYKDTLGNWTIGCGHLIVDEEGNKITDPELLPKVWPKDCIYNQLQRDITSKWEDIKDKDYWKILDTDRRKRAILNMIFNLGQEGFEKFHVFIGYLTKQQWTLAANDLSGTRWHTQLPVRSSRIIQMIKAG